MKNLFIAALCLLTCGNTLAQLTPGFDKDEYLECLCITSNMDSMRVDNGYKAPLPTSFHKVYASPEVGFYNEWELWESDKGVIALALRATVSLPISWMANFNAGMVRAKGTCHVSQDIDYDLCADSMACVHAGWTACLLSMTDDICHKIDSCYNLGRRDFIITGHSQGGALAYLLTAYMRRGQATGKIKSDIRFKTYSSAAPKPGDYLFAVHYEDMTRGGWAFNVVNADDWVPELPLSVQRPTDMRPTNPFANLEELSSELGDMSPTDKFKIKFLLRKLTKPTSESVDNLTKYLGSTIGGMLEDEEPWFKQPVEYADCANFARTGQFIILMPDDDYHASHPQTSKDAFEHHMYKAYHDLAKKLK